MAEILKKLLRIFVVGVVAILPLVITMIVVIWVSSYLTGQLGPNAVFGSGLRKIGVRLSTTKRSPTSSAGCIVLAAVFGLGVLVESGARRLDPRPARQPSLGRFPMLGGIYGTVRQLVGMMDTKGSPDLKGMSVVYLHLRRRHRRRVPGPLAHARTFRIGDVDYNADASSPSAPVPVGGSLLFVPTASVRPAGLTGRRLHEHLRLDGCHRPAVSEAGVAATPQVS